MLPSFSLSVCLEQRVLKFNLSFLYSLRSVSFIFHVRSKIIQHTKFFSKKQEEEDEGKEGKEKKKKKRKAGTSFLRA